MLCWQLGVLGQKHLRCFDTTDKSVHGHTDRNQEGSSDNMHSRDSSNNSRSTQEHISTGKDIVDQAQHHENEMRNPAYAVSKAPHFK